MKKIPEADARRLAAARQALHNHAREYQRAMTPREWVHFAQRDEAIRVIYLGREEMLMRELRAVAAMVWGTWR